MPEEENKGFEDSLNQLQSYNQTFQDDFYQDSLASQYLIAAQKAKATTAYEVAYQYLSLALSSLGNHSWQQQYSLILELTQEAAEVAYLRKNLAQMEEHITEILRFGHSLLDKIKAYEIQIKAYTAQNKLLTAQEIALGVLQQLGIYFPQKPTPEEIQVAFAETKSLCAGKKIEDFLALPCMEDSFQLAAMQLLSRIISSAYPVSTDVLTLIVLKLVNLSLQYGNTSVSAYGYATYGMILCGIAEEIESGYLFGQLALNLLEKFNNPENKAKTLMVVNSHIKPWQEALQTTLEPLHLAYRMGLETGDLESASYSALAFCTHLYFSGYDLGGLEAKISNSYQLLTQLQQNAALGYLQFYWNVISVLKGYSSPSEFLSKEATHEKKLLCEFQSSHNRSGIFKLYLHKLIIAYLFGQIQDALDYANLAADYSQSEAASFLLPVFRFYDSLVRLAVYQQTSSSKQEKLLAQVSINQAKLQQWSDYAPSNYLHKFYLVEAELAQVLGNKIEAIEKYEQAIQLAKASQYKNEEALANELAAKFYNLQGKQVVASVYMQEAHSAYFEWGAVAKVSELEKNYYPLFYKEKFGLIHNQTIKKKDKSLDFLDFTTIMKASHALTGEVSLEKLVIKLIKIVLENAGAEKACLLLQYDDQLLIEATGEIRENKVAVRQALPISIESLPVSVINYVARTQEDIVLDHACQKGLFINDPYIITHKTKSVLCVPISGKGDLIGILYLENNLTLGIFNPEKTSILKLLTYQAAISLENARLYEQLEDYSKTLEKKVRSRTEELQSAMEIADAANRAKSDFLTHMSHELRTPLNSILGFTQLLQQKRFSDNEVQRDYYLGIINRSGKHLLELIDDILDMSKIESNIITLEEEVFDLFALLTNLKELFGLRAQSKNIELVIECDKSLCQFVKADKKKLHQILINILGNALKFTAKGSVVLRIKKEKKLTTERDYLWFEVEDTGCGIYSGDLDKVFEPFVQTEEGRKRNSGSGLGLAISKKFVNLMGGEITVSSQPGKGTIFLFNIAVSLESSECFQMTPPARKVKAIAPHQSKCRILVVEDKWENRQLLLNFLISLGFEVREAQDGIEAIALWESWNPHLIWMDMRMPRMDGYEATKQIKSQRKGQDTVVIALTASAFDDERTAILSAGCDDFVRKPFTEDILLEKIAEHLRIEYIYEESIQEAASIIPPSVELTPDAMAVLPSSLREALHEVARQLDSEECLALLDEIPNQHASLRKAIANLIYNYRFDMIMRLTESPRNP